MLIRNVSQWPGIVGGGADRVYIRRFFGANMVESFHGEAQDLPVWGEWRWPGGGRPLPPSPTSLIASATFSNMIT